MVEGEQGVEQLKTEPDNVEPQHDSHAGEEGTMSLILKNALTLLQ